MVLDLDVNDYDVFLKYIRGIADYIRKEMKLFTVDIMEEAIIKVIVIEAKNKKADKKDDKQKPGSKSNWKKKKGKKARKIQHRRTIVILIKPIDKPQKCWILHPEL